jgi:hypothetical protein
VSLIKIRLGGIRRKELERRCWKDEYQLLVYIVHKKNIQTRKM